MADNLRQSPDGKYSWMGKVQRYIAYGQKGRALRLLEKIIECDMPLFYGLSDVQEDRRLAWLYVFIGPPDLEARVELIRQFMQDRPQEPTDFLEIGSGGRTKTRTWNHIRRAEKQAQKRA
jgi:hypothetical protein